MTDEVFSFDSQPTYLSDADPLSNTTKDLVCTWRSDRGIDGKQYLVWTFNWDKLKERKIVGFTGEIVVNKTIQNNFRRTPIKIEVDLSEDNKTVRKEFSANCKGYNITKYNNINYKYTLIPIFSMEEVYDDMFLPSEKHDAVLEVDGMQLNVNKAFLSYHSDFFASLFSSKFKEGQMSVIPIEDVTYEEIGLLFSSFYPKAVFPKDRDVPKLLELADRFLLSSVIHHVEYHLLNNSKIENEKMTWMADRYGMELLLEKMINQLDTAVKARNLKASSDYMQLSEKTKARILDKVMTLI